MFDWVLNMPFWIALRSIFGLLRDRIQSKKILNRELLAKNLDHYEKKYKKQNKMASKFYRKCSSGF